MRDTIIQLTEKRIRLLQPIGLIRTSEDCSNRKHFEAGIELPESGLTNCALRRMNTITSCARWMVSALTMLCFGAAVAANTSPDVSIAFEEANRAAVSGPADLPLHGLSRLKLPAGDAFVPQPQAGKLLHAMGNPNADPRLLGLVVPLDDAGWFMTVRYEDSGHIKDDDARDWNADELQKSYKEVTEAANEERRKMGVPAIEVLGWAEKPQYDPSTHRLVWAMTSRDQDGGPEQAQGVNYNTYVLGREGYFSMNLLTGLKDLPEHKQAAHALLAALTFDDGKRYSDYNDTTDRTAEYGLAALVVGVAAKKLGFLAAAGLVFAKFSKLIIFGLGALGVGAAKLVGRRKKKSDAPAA